MGSYEMDMEGWDVVDWEEVRRAEGVAAAENLKAGRVAETNMNQKQKWSRGPPIWLPSEGDFLKSRNTDYQVISILSRGSFGNVVRCVRKQSLLSSEVAVKVTSRDRWSAREHAMLKYLARYDNDHKLSKSRHVVGFLGSFVYGHCLCLTFDLVSTDLAKVIRKHAKLPPILTAYVTQQILTALDWLQEANVVHANLTPSNILIDTRGFRWRVRLSDFGCSFLTFHSKAIQGVTVQSLNYRAPEVILGAPLSMSIDMWSLGCVVAEMATGERLFPGSTESIQLHLIVDLMGDIPKWMSHLGMYRDNFFVTPKGRTLALHVTPSSIAALENLSQYRPLPNISDIHDQLCGSFVTECLNLDQNKRMTVSSGLRHCFIRKNYKRFSSLVIYPSYYSENGVSQDKSQ